MARKVTVALVDDLDDTLEANETVEFAIDGVTYEIDLNSKNADKLRKAIKPFVDAGRRSGGRKRAGRPAKVSSSRTPIDRAQSQAIRDWARKEGIKVNDRGRISQETVDAFNAAH